MPIELRWLASTAASALHAAAAMSAGAPLLDGALATAMAEAVEGLLLDLEALGIEPAVFFEHAVPLSVRFDTPGHLVQAVAAKILGPSQAEGMSPGLSRRLTMLYDAYDKFYPQALEELELRSEPLRMQWEARGPGLIHTVARLTEDDLIVETADAILVAPVLGGGGAAHSLYNSVRIEAVLANPLAELPEVVRLGWLVAQLNLDLPQYQGNLRRQRALAIGAWAMIPPVLAAAQEVELARNDLPTLATAIAAWSAKSIDAERLAAWWETYAMDRPEWTVALGALDQMLAAE